MERRRFLASLAGATGVAGCVGAAPVRDSAVSSGGDATTGQRDGLGGGEVPLAEQGFPPTICEESIPEEAGDRGISEPATAADWSGIDVPPAYRGVETAGLAPSSTVIGVTDRDRARAYPLRVLHRIEAVNDTFGGPLLVTFCPICNTGMVAERLVDGEPTTFWLSGLLWQPPGVHAAASEQDERIFGSSRSNPDEEVRRSGNLVMVDDRTGSYWSQFLARAICGPARGTELTIRPATTATWGDWRETHPDSDVLLPPPYSTPID